MLRLKTSFVLSLIPLKVALGIPSLRQENIMSNIRAPCSRRSKHTDRFSSPRSRHTSPLPRANKREPPALWRMFPPIRPPTKKAAPKMNVSKRYPLPGNPAFPQKLPIWWLELGSSRKRQAPRSGEAQEDRGLYTER